MPNDEQSLREVIARNITAYRKSAGDTQASLAAKLNYSDKAVSKWERAESMPDIWILYRIASLYGITVSNLIGEEEPPRESQPTFHLFVLALSVGLTFLVAVVLFAVFRIADINFRSWLFFVYAVTVSSIICIVFTSIWWGILWQTVSVSVLIWSLGLSIFLSIPLPNGHLLFIVCIAVQLLLLLWNLFRLYKKRNRKRT